MVQVEEKNWSSFRPTKLEEGSSVGTAGLDVSFVKPVIAMKSVKPIREILRSRRFFREVSILLCGFAAITTLVSILVDSFTLNAGMSLPVQRGS